MTNILCQHLRVIDDRKIECAVMAAYGIGAVAGPSNPNFPCRSCVAEANGTTPDVKNLTPTLKKFLRLIIGGDPKPPPNPPSPCRFLGPTLDRLNCNCPNQHIRACEIVGETTLPGCARCPHYVADDDSDEWDDTRQRLILECDLCPGDVVMLTAAVRELHRQYPGQYVTDVRTNHPDFWRNNPFVQPVASAGARTIEMHYPLINVANQSPVHFIEGYCAYLAEKLGLPVLRPTEFRGQVFLDDGERSSETPYPHPFWLVNAGTKSDYTAKQWPIESFQAVVDAFRDRITFVQVGAAADHHPKLEGVVDLVGKTTLRELIRLVHHADGCLTGVSLLMHLAAAVPRARGQSGLRPCVVVAGGREPAHWEQYPGHAFLHTIGELPCCESGGCWRSRTVALGDDSPHDRSLCSRPVDGSPECMRRISPADVIRAIQRQSGVDPSGSPRAYSEAYAAPRRALRVGVVIGSFNMPSAVRLNVAAIRHHCGPDVPILISDDCSDGFAPTPDPASLFGRLVEIVSETPNVTLWPSVERIGHAGGDLRAVWAGLQWAKAIGLDVLVKLSQRYIWDVPAWTGLAALELERSGKPTLGRECGWHHWELRTECVAMDVRRWANAGVFAHLTPRRVAWAAEQVLADTARDHVGGGIAQWSLMSDARPTPIAGALFREANPQADYEALADRLGVALGPDFHTDDSNQAAGYLVG